MDLRRALSKRLSDLELAPHGLIVFLANDKIDVARPVLKYSPILKDIDLKMIIMSQGEEHWQAIADRENLTRSVIHALAETGDINTAINVSNNQDVKISRNSLELFCEMAKESEALAKPLLHRSEIPSDLAKTLYAYVGQELKTYITHYRKFLVRTRPLCVNGRTGITGMNNIKLY